MLRIAVTGGIACGKSLLGTFMQNAGVHVCDADDLVHRMLDEQADLQERLIDEFGESIAGEIQTIDRRKLAKIVFADKAKLDRLTSIVHPRVIEQWNEWLVDMEGALNADGERGMACVIAPLLYELRLESGWDAVICIVASRTICQTRLNEKGVVHFERRMQLQQPTWDKAARADYVIVNNGTVESVECQWNKVYKCIRENNE